MITYTGKGKKGTIITARGKICYFATTIFLVTAEPLMLNV
jgi:hypothetical protein